jgi:hypothetical protein
MKMNYEECRLQISVLKWFSLQYPNLEGLLVGYPAGVYLDLRTASRMKAMGLRPGYPDLHLLVASKGSHALFIELKSTKGRASKVQQDFHHKLRSQDYTVIICKSFEDVQEGIFDYLN